MARYPTRPPATDEQRTLPLGCTLEARYTAWRGSLEGATSYAWIKREALRRWYAGTRRLSAKGLVELCRATTQLPINNDFTALIARQLGDDFPALLPLFELRKRHVA